MDTMIDVFQATFETWATRMGIGDTRRRILESSEDDLLRLHENYVEYRSAHQEGQAQRNRLNPYIPTHLDTGLSKRLAVPMLTDSLDDAKIEEFVRAIKLHLLYAHSVSVPNPFVYIDDLIAYPTGNEELHKSNVGRIVQYFDLLRLVEPLISHGVLNFIEVQSATINRGLSAGGRTQLSNAAEVLDLSAEQLGLSAETADRWNAMFRPDRPITTQLSEDLIEFLIGQFRVIQELNFSTDFYLRNPGDATALGWLLASLDDPNFGALLNGLRRSEVVQPAGESLTLTQICSVDLPDFTLSTEDIVRVREDAAFGTWRTTVEEALENVEDLSDDILAPHRRVSIDNEIGSQLIEGQRRLERKIEGSSFLSNAMATAKTLAVGSVVALVLTPFAPPAATLASAGLSSAIDLALAYRRERLPSSDRALLNHYMVFTDTHLR